MPPAKRLPIRALLEHMIEHNATDLFLSPGAPAKMSYDGLFADATSAPLSTEDTDAYAAELMRPHEAEEFARELEVNLSHQFNDAARFRINIFTQRDATSLVVRRIAMRIPGLGELGLPPQLGRLAMAERGLVILAGATGSGKSTSAAAMIDHRNRAEGGHIVTIEDPIEFIHPNHLALVSQREVGIDTRSFHKALRNSLRQAPRVIFIGEARDTETMAFAIHAAETGHLVLTTLHSNNSPQTIERILNFFDKELHRQVLLQLSLNLRGIVSQRLPKRADGGGRVAAVEVLLNTPTVAERIENGDVRGIREALESGRHEGLQSFDQHLHQLWRDGAVSEEEAFRHADSANNLRLRMRGIRLAV